MLSYPEIVYKFKESLEEAIAENQLNLLIGAGKSEDIFIGEKGAEILAPLLQAGWLYHIGNDKYSITEKGKETLEKYNLLLKEMIK